MLKRLAWLSALALLACDESGLAGSPQMTLTVENGGSTLKVEWYRVVGADKYRLLVDSQQVYEGTDTVYYIDSPCVTIKCIAVGGTETTSDEEDLTAATDSFDLWERDGEGVAAVGFNGLGEYTLYALSDTDSTHQDAFRFYLDDFRLDTTIRDSVRMVSPNLNAFGEPFSKCQTWFAPWPGNSISAPDTASYVKEYSGILCADSTYALWLDVDDNGWEEGHSSDHFLKVKVLAAPDSSGMVVFRYWFQKKAGLRWVPEPSE